MSMFKRLFGNGGLGIGGHHSSGMSQSRHSGRHGNRHNPQDNGTIPCANCQATNTTSSRYCHRCGQSLQIQAASCSQCQEPLAAGSRFCQKCGQATQA